MHKRQTIATLAFIAAVGAVLPFVVPNDWLKYALGTGLVSALVGCVLCSVSAERKKTGIAGVFSLLAIGTSHPEGEVRDPQAMLLFFASLSFLAGLTIGAFIAV